jgi:microsomal dipeptidase-like Zn-dependent dipeptidase
MALNIDIHCHTSSKPFMSGIGEQRLSMYESKKFKLDHPIYKLLRKPLEKMSHINLSTQSNFDELFEGDVRLAFVSITPIEKAFTVLNPDAKGLKSRLVKAFMGEKSNYRDGFVSSFAINALTGFKASDIDLVKSGITDIYRDLFLKEMDFLSSVHNKKSPNNKYSVRLPKNLTELRENLKDETILNVIINVEGGHVFGKTATLPEIQAGRTNKHKKDDHDLSLATLLCKNIKDVRTRYPFPIFSVSLCHHFWNGMAGHARSLASLCESVFNQEEGLNGPLMEVGKSVIREFNETEYDGKKVSKIVVDIKHMSPQCRKDYYAYLRSTPALKKNPVFCSHTGISMSFETLDEWIKYVELNPTEKSGKRYEEGSYYLHEQSINLCKEDLVAIYESKGLLGIQLDEKRIMGPLALNELKARSDLGGKGEQKYVYAKAIWANLFCAVDELGKAGVKNKPDVWDIFAIGSDFDGLINHLDTFGTSSSMHDLKATMSYFLQEPEEIILFFKDKNTQYTLNLDEINQLKCGRSNHQLIERIFSQNALNFLERNFNSI